MSDSESSELIDSEVGMEEEENSDFNSSDNGGSEENHSESESDEVENENEESDQNSVQEVFMSDSDIDGEEVSDDSSEESEEERKLTEEELRRINLDDFSSDDEVLQGWAHYSQEAGNTIGNIPIKWYDKYDHIGYDLNGEKIMRPKSLDAIDKYIHTHDKNER